MKKIDSSRKIQKGTILRIYKKGFGYARLEIFENNDLYFSAYAFNKDLISNISINDKIEVYIWIENEASYEFSTEVAGLIPEGSVSNNGILFLKHSKNITKNTKRKCLKANVNIPVKFFVFDTGKIEKNFETEEIIFHNGIITEIGDREAKMECPEKIEEDSFLYGHITIDFQNLEIIGKIESVPQGNEKLYKISYPGLSEKDRAKILDYIFDVYRE